MKNSNSSSTSLTKLRNDWYACAPALVTGCAVKEQGLNNPDQQFPIVLIRYLSPNLVIGG